MVDCIAWHGTDIKKPALSVRQSFMVAMVQDGKPKARFIKICCSISILD